jgi:hypothetical protein
MQFFNNEQYVNKNKERSIDFCINKGRKLTNPITPSLSSMEKKPFTYGTWKYEKNPRLGIAMPAAKTIRFH